MTTHIKPQQMAVHCHSPPNTSRSQLPLHTATTRAPCPYPQCDGSPRSPCGVQANGTWAADCGQADALLLVHLSSRRSTVDSCNQPSLQPMRPVLVHLQHVATRLYYFHRQLEKIDRGTNFAHPKSFKPSSVLLSTGAVTFAGCPH